MNKSVNSYLYRDGGYSSIARFYLENEIIWNSQVLRKEIREFLKSVGFVWHRKVDAEETHPGHVEVLVIYDQYYSLELPVGINLKERHSLLEKQSDTIISQMEIRLSHLEKLRLCIP